MHEPSVVVLMLYYRGAEISHFKEVVESILSQTYRNIKLYIGVDGVVFDEQKAVLESYAKEDLVKMIWFDKNRGLACVLNDLIDKALDDGHQFLARMDSGDIFYLRDWNCKCIISRNTVKLM